jgi:hypothetical protein
MKVHELNGRKIVAVKLPGDSTQVWWLDTRQKSLVVGDYDRYSPITLPEGNWEILGRVNEITEQAWDKIVEIDYFDGVGPQFANYALKHPWTFGKRFHSAKASGLSWCRANSIDLQDLILIDKQ